MKKPKAGRTRAAKNKEPSYKIVTLSMPPADISWLDGVSRRLEELGVIKASRSMVIKEAIARLRDETDSLKPNELATNFMDRRAKRAKRV